MTRRLILILALFTLARPVQAAPPTVDSIFPGVGQRGTEFTLKLTGARFTDAREILFYHEGIRCLKMEVKSENEAIATLKSEAQARLGEYPFRLVTPSGVSELHTLHLTTLPVVLEAATENNSLAGAQKIPFNSTVVGIIETADIDSYSVQLKKGELLSVEVSGVRLGASSLDPVLELFGPDGKKLRHVDDTGLYRQDPFISLLAPVDGTYTVQIRDTAYDGGDGYRYALHIGSFRRPRAVYPLGVQAEVATSLTLLGDNPTTQLLTAKTTPDGFYSFYPSENSPTPVPLRVSKFPNVLETEPNDRLDPKATPTAWPVAFNGVIAKAGDIDHFAFTARKGETIQLTTYADRLGSLLDSVVSVLDANGDLLVASDDDQTHDSACRFTAPRDGTYFVRVEDKRKQGGADFLYRVELDTPRKGMELFLASPERKTQNRQVIVVPKGGRVAAFLGVRRDGFSDAIKITPTGLPEGVEFGKGLELNEDEYLLPVVVEASLTAQPGTKRISLQSQAKSDPSIRGGFAQVVSLVRGPGDSTLHQVRVQELCLVVVEEAPFSVSLIPPKTALARDGMIDLTVRVERSKEFTREIEVEIPTLPPGVEAPQSIMIPAEQSEGTITLTAQPGAEIGNWPLFVEAKPASSARTRRDPLMPMGMGDPAVPRKNRTESKGSLSVDRVSSRLIALELIAPPIQARFKPAAVEQGKSVTVTCQLTANTIPAGFTATLIGLPPRSTAEPLKLDPKQREVTFLVKVDPTSPVGTHSSLICQLSGTIDGQKVSYLLGRSGSLTITVPGAVKVDADGRPLSPLEALRREAKEKK